MWRGWRPPSLAVRNDPADPADAAAGGRGARGLPARHGRAGPALPRGAEGRSVLGGGVCLPPLLIFIIMRSKVILCRHLAIPKKSFF